MGGRQYRICSPQVTGCPTNKQSRYLNNSHVLPLPCLPQTAPRAGDTRLCYSLDAFAMSSRRCDDPILWEGNLRSWLTITRTSVRGRAWILPRAETETLIPAPRCHQAPCGGTWRWPSTVSISGEGRVGYWGVIGLRDTGGFPLPLNPDSPGCELKVPHSLMTTGCVQMKFPVPGWGCPRFNPCRAPSTCSNKPRRR